MACSLNTASAKREHCFLIHLSWACASLAFANGKPYKNEIIPQALVFAELDCRRSALHAACLPVATRLRQPVDSRVDG